MTAVASRVGVRITRDVEGPGWGGQRHHPEQRGGVVRLVSAMPTALIVNPNVVGATVDARPTSSASSSPERTP